MFFRAEAYGFSREFIDYVRDVPVKPERGTVTGRALLEGKIIHIADVLADPDYSWSEAQRLGGFRTILGVPMLREGIPIGVLALTRDDVRPFTQKQIELVSTFADQAAIAIENVRLFDEIQEKNRQLAEASENKSQFVSSMSHELRTPLNAIIGLTEMMVTNAARFGTEKAQEPLQRVNRAGTHLLGLINQVLDLSKIEAGKLELNPQTVQLAPLIEEVIGTARQLAEQNKNRLVVDAQENLGALTVDPHAAAADPAQSAEQCLQVHQGGRGQAAGKQGRQRPRLDRAVRFRYRHRHDAGAAGKAVRGVHPGRCLDRAAFRRHRPWPCHHPQARPHDGRRRDSDERAGQRLGFYSAPAGRRAHINAVMALRCIRGPAIFWQLSDQQRTSQDFSPSWLSSD